MSFSYYILTGVILMYRHTCYNTVSCQDVSMILPRRVLLQQEKLKFGCSPSNVARWNGVTHIILSKNISAGFQDIVSVELELKGTIRNKTVWRQSNWRTRAIVIKESVYPVTNSTGLEFDIQPDYVLCSDEGTYRCKVIGISKNNQPIEREKIGTMELTVKPTTINQIEVSAKPEIEELYKPNTQIELRCTGTVGRNPAGVLRWCYRSDDMLNFIGWPNPDDYDQGTLFSYGCQNSRTSILRYNVTSDYHYTEFRCETGGTSVICGHHNSIASNITVYRYSEPKPSTTLTSGQTEDSGSLQSTSVITTETKESASGDSTSRGSTLKTTEKSILIVCAVFLYLLVNG